MSLQLSKRIKENCQTHIQVPIPPRNVEVLIKIVKNMEGFEDLQNFILKKANQIFLPKKIVF